MPTSTQPPTAARNTQTSTPPPYPTPAPIIDPRQLKKRHHTGSEACGYRTDAQFRPFACGSGLTCTNSNNVRACCTDCDHSTFATECRDRHPHALRRVLGGLAILAC
ncbi:hypothetical protein MCOR02_001256 [Pyricularia oryzae]|uniref:Uncharacterized protein n=1 Tax=Pyricularia grisea TaxID=148305 RepID=A0ABQ8NSI5_PYRGI|nr:hypothetical protein MCOR01_011311 [Pyricularia oryzae]KAI6301506.1 hypothetical protein MCOR33_003032 [Pyricularia grisea]KAH9437599.1 hypothetical protein MCOR02_001256 [Pyricularia oryzae]KAI6259329.1 hypothetical protein MCOR19_004349 [Pyricularia oryzae]KAI6312680.1 hypothetical protein MCOR34_005472 [Pyricularia oryzae]